MDANLLNSDSTIMWSTTSSKGVVFSTNLPRVVTSLREYLLVDTVIGDSDPVYWAVARAYEHQDFGPDWAKKFALGMLTYYDMEIAFKTAELPNDAVWDYLLETYPIARRGSQRRHFRGAQGAAALACMVEFSPKPEQFFNQMGMTYREVSITCEKNLLQFGPYFQLKVCDYMDLCLDYPLLSYDGLEYNLPTEPEKAVKMMFPGARTPEAFRLLCKQAKAWDILAPPAFKRPIGPAEIETGLCDWKTAKYGGNWLGADILDKRGVLDSLAAQNPRAAQFQNFLPPLVPEGTFICEL